VAAEVKRTEGLERPSDALTDAETASILVVDDRPESLLAIDAALESLGQNIVKAGSGPEALRHLLRQDFALILLDVNMPRMDGFQTAALIRARRRSAHTPIIFMTAYANDMHIARGYSLGAVDYIPSPVVPEVLRSKVAVFVELYRKNAQISRQAALLGERAARERRLTDASLALHSVCSLGELLEVVAVTAAELVEGRWACVTASSELRGGATRSFACIDGQIIRDALRKGTALGQLSPLARPVVEHNQPARAVDAEIELRAFAGNHAVLGEVEPLVAGWIGVPLRRRDGTNMGLIQVAGLSGELDYEDQAVLMQLAHMASIAVENCLLAEEREANQLKDEFLATLSHELRTPLNSILGWLHLLDGQDAGKTPQILEGLSVIERSVHAQNRLIEDLLDVSRIARGQLRFEHEPVDLGLVVRASIDAARPTAGKRDIALSLEGDGIESFMLGDSDRVNQILGNLLSNAIKFTPRGGRVRVRMEVGPDKARISVIDTGEGIGPEFLPLVFQRFRQADHGHTRRFSGLGIGLTIVKHLVEAHGGSVHLSSAGLGRGTTAVVEFPLLPRASASLPAVEGPAAEGIDCSSDLAGIRVLVVDDQADARDVAARVLQRSGAEVFGVASAAEALSLIIRTAPDLIISDLAMPGESGFSLIARVRKLPPPLDGTPAIALSALVGPENSAQALSAGFQVHAPKPCEPAHLVSLAARLTAGRSGRAVDRWTLSTSPKAR
jgi:signal transduction histidine kinase/DNA-binding response OmpR family regulator